MKRTQPPSGGCVLKLTTYLLSGDFKTQPPSGGCVLKLTMGVDVQHDRLASRLQAAVC